MEKETLIYKYFEGTLTEKERATFDRLLVEDPGFLEELGFEEDVKRVILDTERSSLKRKLQGFEIDLSQPAGPRLPFWKTLQIAASLAVIFAMGWYFYSLGSSHKMEGLYTENYEKYPNTVYSITRGNANDTSMERNAFEAYEQNETKAALYYFQELKGKSAPGYIDFYLAQTYLANGNTQLALDIFLGILLSKTDFKTETLWYTSLCYLKLEKPEEAIPFLKELIRQGTYKKEAALTILHQLE